MYRLYCLVTATIVALGAVASPTAAATFTSGSISLTGIGAQFPSVFDDINIAGGSGTFLDAGQLGVNIASGAFVVGVNCNPCTNENPTGSFTESFSVNGSATQNFVIDWSWLSTGPTDFLALSINQGVLDIGGYIATLHITPMNLSGSGGSVPFSLTADLVATPIPAALPLFASALGAMGLLGWRRKRKGAAVGRG
jgi:hypothetical protein